MWTHIDHIRLKKTQVWVNVSTKVQSLHHRYQILILHILWRGFGSYDWYVLSKPYPCLNSHRKEWARVLLGIFCSLSGVDIVFWLALVPTINCCSHSSSGLFFLFVCVQDLTEFNTAHNKRIQSIGIEEPSANIVPSLKRKRSSTAAVHFREGEEVINPGKLHMQVTFATICVDILMMIVHSVYYGDKVAWTTELLWKWWGW